MVVRMRDLIATPGSVLLWVQLTFNALYLDARQFNKRHKVFPLVSFSEFLNLN